MGAVELGMGIYMIEAETDPAKIQKAGEKFQEWSQLFSQVKETSNLFGWDSIECQVARYELSQWQLQERSGFIDQNTHSIYSII